jgi:hypothetical protein
VSTASLAGRGNCQRFPAADSVRNDLRATTSVCMLAPPIVFKEVIMPDKTTLERARADARQGKSPSTQAGEFVREEIQHIREGKHGARSAKQAIAIGLSKARKAGVPLPAAPGGKGKSAPAGTAAQRGMRQPSSESTAKRKRATLGALKKEPRAAASHAALSRHAHASAAERGAASWRAAAEKAAATRARRVPSKRAR